MDFSQVRERTFLMRVHTPSCVRKYYTFLYGDITLTYLSERRFFFLTHIFLHHILFSTFETSAHLFSFATLFLVSFLPDHFFPFSLSFYFSFFFSFFFILSLHHFLIPSSTFLSPPLISSQRDKFLCPSLFFTSFPPKNSSPLSTFPSLWFPSLLFSFPFSLSSPPNPPHISAHLVPFPTARLVWRHPRVSQSTGHCYVRICFHWRCDRKRNTGRR